MDDFDEMFAALHHKKENMITKEELYKKLILCLPVNKKLRSISKLYSWSGKCLI